MDEFGNFYNKLVNGQIKKIKFEQEELEIIGVARYSSNNYPDEYVKVLLQDEFVLVVSPASKEISFGEFLGKIEGITDEKIGQEETFDYNNKIYKLENKKDHQTRIEILVGGQNDVEGDCDFSDYYTEDGECLSLGWFSNGERADVHTKPISLSDLEYDNLQ